MVHFLPPCMLLLAVVMYTYVAVLLDDSVMWCVHCCSVFTLMLRIVQYIPSRCSSVVPSSPFPALKWKTAHCTSFACNHARVRGPCFCSRQCSAAVVICQPGWPAHFLDASSDIECTVHLPLLPNALPLLSLFVLPSLKEKCRWQWWLLERSAKFCIIVGPGPGQLIYLSLIHIWRCRRRG